jgi:hypothetical protein|uniref:Uncharacterized protein n=1 Tax=Fagus sylvatica TaxID=28930 RepID=A0A2N9E5Z5_FAGSY
MKSSVVPDKQHRGAEMSADELSPKRADDQIGERDEKLQHSSD